MFYAATYSFCWGNVMCHESFNNKSIEGVMRSLIILLLVALAWRCFSNALMIWLFFIFY